MSPMTVNLDELRRECDRLILRLSAVLEHKGVQRMKRYRSHRIAAPPHAFKLCVKNLPILRRLYGDDITIGEAKALFPLKVVGEGPGRRYWVIPRIVDRWLDELPSA